MKVESSAFYRIIRRKVLDEFLDRVIHEQLKITRLTIVSPWITPLEDQQYPLSWIISKIPKSTYLSVITRYPDKEPHKEAVGILSEHPNSEIIFNRDLHSKLYIAVFDRGKKKLGMLASANLTNRGNTQCEIGMLFFYIRIGRKIIDELENQTYIIKTLPRSKIVKRRGSINRI